MIEAARLLCYHTLYSKDQRHTHAKESDLAKLLAARSAVDSIHNCLLIHGQVGYITELPLEQRLRKFVGLSIGDGATDIMKLIVSRELLGRESLSY